MLADHGPPVIISRPSSNSTPSLTLPAPKRDAFSSGDRLSNSGKSSTTVRGLRTGFIADSSGKNVVAYDSDRLPEQADRNRLPSNHAGTRSGSYALPCAATTHRRQGHHDFIALAGMGARPPL